MGAGGKSEIDTDAAKKILKILEDNLATFDTGYGTPSDIQGRGNVTQADLGGSAGFSAGQQLGENTARAYSVINQEYTTFVNAYGQVIEALRRAVNNHDEKEQTNTAAANSVQVSHTSRPTTGNTRAY
ncbi:hypothetical protein Arub01_35040 [Actinomadura rubrobrunea]|uniref:Uncharacterized protein n=1 Tax=Actinomadura rubrobrunea TaxID=115335 RepID=A0A9W6PVM7_9ACTN|nr:hypothetical protein [Actinomadura rubrobrunea]GLW65260.1 hypothetical protein Arub01_35040 [Actinomadura rubrobrunea]